MSVLLQGKAICALTEAVIRTASRARQTYWRRPADPLTLLNAASCGNSTLPMAPRARGSVNPDRNMAHGGTTE